VCIECRQNPCDPIDDKELDICKDLGIKTKKSKKIREELQGIDDMENGGPDYGKNI